MKTIIQKTTGFLFLTLGISPVLIITVFIVKEQVIQFEMRKKLGSSELQKVMVPENEVVWMDDHEIWVNESMFDIRTQKLENGVYTFTGMYDPEETKIVLSHRKMNEKQKDEGLFFSKLFKYLQTFYFEQSSTDNVSTNNTGLIPYFDQGLKDPYCSIPFPPPKKG